MTTHIHLTPAMFTAVDTPLLSSGSLRATTFRWPSGVCGLRVENELGSLTLLPFQGQQIWSAEFGAGTHASEKSGAQQEAARRNITMKSMFDMPRATQTYLENYGGFLIHCGFTAMGIPTAEDSHPVHGELPNAPYRSATIVLGEDERGTYIGLTGEYHHTVAFSYNYVAQPITKLYSGSSRFVTRFSATNLKKTPMDYMYMAHVNFRPIDNGRLVYSAPSTTDHVKLRESIPSHITPTPEYIKFMGELRDNPARHHTLSPDMAFDPEIVFNVDYLADKDGWAHTMQIHSDGSADYIAHQREQLNVGVRWICRTPDQDALGMVLPATAGPEGYSTEKAKGLVRSLAGGETFNCEMEMGVLTADEVKKVEKTIDSILNE